MSTTRTAIYARISSDDGSALGVARQVADCTDLAERRGWTVLETFTDNDVSASSGVRRPEYERLMSAIASGLVDSLIVWDVDRLTRTPAELETFIDLAERHGIELASVGGEIDLATPQGRLTARIKGSVARHEVEQQSRRLRRKFLERAEAGKPHGRVAFGYLRERALNESGVVVGTTEVLHPKEAAVIQSSARRLLAGEPLRAVVRDLNAAGASGPSGKPWTGTTLRQVLLRDRNAARRVHQGQVIGRGDWPAVLDDDTFDRLAALLRDPRRRSNRGSEVKHLLSGLALCGRCGGRMRAIVGGRYGGKTMPRAYACSECHKVRRKADAVDEVVEGVVVARLARPDAAGLFGGDPVALTEATEQKEALEARMETAADQFADGIITGTQLERINARLRPQVAAAETRIRSARPADDLADLASPDIARTWQTLSIERKRAAIEAIMTVTILPTGSGGRFDPEAVRVEWKGEA